MKTFYPAAVDTYIFMAADRTRAAGEIRAAGGTRAAGEIRATGGTRAADHIRAAGRPGFPGTILRGIKAA